MEKWLRENLILSFALVGLVAAIVGGVVALTFFKPDPVIQEVVVEVEQAEPPLTPSPESLAVLTERYVELAGSNDEWSASLVEEIGAAVCDGGYTGTQVMAEFGIDIDLAQAELDEFVREVRSECPEGI